MKENKISLKEALNTPVSIEETSLAGTYRGESVDNSLIDETGNKIIKNDLPKYIGNNENEWYYFISHESANNNTLYKVDDSGNLIDKVKYSYGKSFDNSGKETTDKEDEIKLIENSKEQINFMERQEQLKDKIKGYPELDENVLKLLNPDEIYYRFRDEKNTLRALLKSDFKDIIRFLLSLLKWNSYDDVMKLVEDRVIYDGKFTGNYIANRIARYICNYLSLYNKLPSVEFVVNMLKLPYSKEFFDEYFLDYDTTQVYIESLYQSKVKQCFREINNNYSNGTMKVEQAIDELNKAQMKYTPPIIDDNFDKLQNILDERKKEITISTGIEYLDNRNALLRKGQIGTVFAYTGGFKTMFSSNVAFNVMNNNGNVLYLSLEVTKEDMYINFLSRYSYEYDTKISHSDIKGGRLTLEEEAYLFDKIYPSFRDELKQHLMIYDETDIKVYTYSELNKLFALAERDFIRNTGKGIDLIIIDHLNLFKFGDDRKGMNDYSVVNHWMSYFRKTCVDFLGKKKKVAILCACQSSREGYKEACKNSGYQLTGIAEGNEIERSSQMVLSIYTDEHMKEENEAKLQVLKLRDEEQKELTATVKIAPQYYTFGIETIEEKQSEEDEYSNYSNNTTAFEEEEYER